MVLIQIDLILRKTQSKFLQLNQTHFPIVRWDLLEQFLIQPIAICLFIATTVVGQFSNVYTCSITM